jgi:hypothetical protein
MYNQSRTWSIAQAIVQTIVQAIVHTNLASEFSVPASAAALLRREGAREGQPQLWIRSLARSLVISPPRATLPELLIVVVFRVYR